MDSRGHDRMSKAIKQMKLNFPKEKMVDTGQEEQELLWSHFFQVRKNEEGTNDSSIP